MDSLLSFHRPVNNVQQPLDRSICARTISQLLWSQHCLEHGQPLQRMQDADVATVKPFIEAGEFITNLTLEPERAETAVMCMADQICLGEYQGDIGMEDLYSGSQLRMLQTAQSALHALKLNVRDVPPDPDYRARMRQLLDTLATR